MPFLPVRTAVATTAVSRLARCVFSMPKLPWFPFYIGDWTKDPNLRRATRSEKGLLMDLLCLMFESGERGVLASSGVPWNDDEIINAAGGDAIGTAHELAELVRKGVLSRRTDGALFSRRLVREETIRQIRSAAGKKGGNPVLLKQKVKLILTTQVKQTSKQISVNETENEIVLKKKGKASYEEVKAFCSGLSLPASDGEWFWNKCEGNGWANGGKPIRDWRATIRSWKAAGYLPSQKSHSNGIKSATEPEPETAGWRELKAEMEAALGKRRS